RGVGDHDAPPGRRGHVDVVVADGHVGHHAKPRGLRQEGVVDRVSEEAYQAVGVAEQRDEFRQPESAILGGEADGRAAPRKGESLLRQVARDEKGAPHETLLSRLRAVASAGEACNYRKEKTGSGSTQLLPLAESLDPERSGLTGVRSAAILALA